MNRKWVKLDTSQRPDIKSLIAQLDKISKYVSSTEVERQQSLPRGIVGFHVRHINNEYRVVNVFENAAANKGMRRGDTILEIDHEPAADLPFPEILRKLRGEPGTEVALQIRTWDNQIRELKVTRTEQYLSPVLFQMIGNGIGYLRINEFNDNTPLEVNEGIRRALDEYNMQALILDLRANPGGLFNGILKTTEFFLEKNDIICTLISGANVERTYKTESSSVYPKFPIVVLVDDSTASGAEIFSAALMENKRAMVAGVKTRGTGELLTIYELADRSQLRITTSYIQTPARKPIHGRGILPDRVVSLSDYDKRSLYNRINYLSHDINADIASDLQLKTAVRMLNEEIQKRKKKKSSE